MTTGRCCRHPLAWWVWAVRVLLVNRPVRVVDGLRVTDDLEELLTDDEALGRRAAAAILAADAAMGSVLYSIRCGDGETID